MIELRKGVTSVKLSNKLKLLGVTIPGIYFRDYTGSKPNDIDKSKGRRYYFVDNVNCYTAEELGNLVVSLIQQGIYKP